VVPVAAEVRVVQWDHDDVAHARGDLLVAARAHVRLGRLERVKAADFDVAF
jgi:hypothetical protein